MILPYEWAPAIPDAPTDHIKHPMAMDVLGRMALASKVPGMEKTIYVT
jgi:hypothetical protein